LLLLLLRAGEAPAQQFALQIVDLLNDLYVLEDRQLPAVLCDGLVLGEGLVELRATGLHMTSRLKHLALHAPGLALVDPTLILLEVLLLDELVELLLVGVDPEVLLKQLLEELLASLFEGLVLLQRHEVLNELELRHVDVELALLAHLVLDAGLNVVNDATLRQVRDLKVFGELGGA